jgi:hypothetical protein
MCNSQNLCKAAIVILIWNGFSALATVYDSDGSSINIQYIHDNLAVDGDTITLPSGTFHWTSTVSVTKSITVRGNTTVTGTQDSQTANDVTVVIDDVPLDANGDHSIITFVPPTNGILARLSGITFRHGLTTQNGQNGGVIISGTSTTIRVDNCHLDHLADSQPFIVYQKAYGVMDHCIIDSGAPGNYSQTAQFVNGGTLDPWGDETWAETSQFGTNKFFFMEDCTFNFGSPEIGGGGGLDALRGGKYVVRYCTLHNMLAQSHGTDSGGRYRGVRAVEIYNNIFRFDSGFAAQSGQFRGGCGLAHDNVIINSDNTYDHFMTMGTYRSWFPFSPFGGHSEPACGT